MRVPRTLVLFALVPLLAFGTAAAQTVEGVDPHLIASEGSPGRVRLEWQAVTGATAYRIERRVFPGAPWTAAVTLGAAQTNWEDPDSTPGVAVEYHVATSGSAAPGHAYIHAGLDVPFREDPGAALIVVDSKSAADLSAKLDRLARDLEGEGWFVHRAEVDKTATPPTVKARIEEVNALANGQLRAVLLLGEVPRAFSGLLNPDAHPDHVGAWPADGYFADLTGTWTDVVNLGGQGAFVNVAGDGKFDQTFLPAALSIAVGRVDTAGMPAFSPATPQELLARYLDANHAYRHGAVRFERRTLVVDSFGYFNGEAFARLAWRDGWAAFGAPPTVGGGFFTRLEEEGGYALAFGCGGGNPTGAGGVGTTQDFVTRTPRAAFMGLFGSYFGDWSYSDNFLRASLLSNGAVLGAAWFARPYLHLHGLGALQTFGEAYLATANNTGADYDGGYMPGGVHQALLGDPTLRLFVTRPPTGLTAAAVPGAIDLSWSASPDATHGYHVFRHTEGTTEPEFRLTGERLTGTTFRDTQVLPDVTFRYRVVAVERLTTGSGTFFNHSLGPTAMAAGLAPQPADAGTQPPPELPDDVDAASCGCGHGPGAAVPLALAAIAALGIRRRKRRDSAEEMRR